jgi:gas vesicle protein
VLADADIDIEEMPNMHNLRHGHQTEMGTAGGFLAGLVVGGLAGAGTALLLAPESGKKTRADIQQKGIELRDQAAETVEGAMADARVKAREIAAPVRKQAEEIKQRTEEIVEQQRDRLSSEAGWASPK